MSDIAYWKEEYEKEVDALGGLVASLKDSKTKDKIYTECDARFAKLKDIKKSYGLELRLLKGVIVFISTSRKTLISPPLLLDKIERAKFDAEGKGYEKRMNEYLDLIKDSKAGAQKETLMKGATGAFGVGTS